MYSYEEIRQDAYDSSRIYSALSESRLNYETAQTTGGAQMPGIANLLPAPPPLPTLPAISALTPTAPTASPPYQVPPTIPTVETPTYQGQHQGQNTPQSTAIDWSPPFSGLSLTGTPLGRNF